MLPHELENVLLEISMDPMSYLAGVRRARTLRSRYEVGVDVTHVHRRFRSLLADSRALLRVPTSRPQTN